ncbi:MAG: hypothetical protein ACK41Q_05325 [Candidatus Brocadia sp.]
MIFPVLFKLRIGKKEIKEEICGTAVVTMNEEGFNKKGNAPSGPGDSSYEGVTFKGTFKFEFGAEITECGDPLDEKCFEVKTSPQDHDAGGGNLGQVRLEFDQNAMTQIVERILKKNGETVRDALGLDDCFFATDVERNQTVELLVNHISGMAYIKDTYIKISFSGNCEIRVSDPSAEQKRHLQKISGKLNIPL